MSGRQLSPHLKLDTYLQSFYHVACKSFREAEGLISCQPFTEGEVVSFRAITYDKSGHVLTITLARPPANAIDLALARAVKEAVQEASSDDDVWVVIITGAGKAFSTGSVFDLKALHRRVRGTSRTQPQIASLRLSQTLLQLRKPVVAVINGDALGQGLELALACDIRLASRRARLGLPQVKQGIIPWDGGTQLLPRLVGRARAIELILTSRILTAREAQQIGLVNKVVASADLRAEAQELAEKLASAGPVASRYTKEAVVKGLDMPLEQGLSLEADLSILLHSTKDRAEGVRSFLERRKPSFRGE